MAKHSPDTLHGAKLRICEIGNSLNGGRAIARLIAKTDDEGAADIALAVAGFLDLLESQVDGLRDELDRLDHQAALATLG